MRAGLDRAHLDPDPIVQFQEWFEKVIDADLHEPNAMIVSTASTDGKPSARTVLLKGYDERGFVVFRVGRRAPRCARSRETSYAARTRRNSSGGPP